MRLVIKFKLLLGVMLGSHGAGGIAYSRLHCRCYSNVPREPARDVVDCKAMLSRMSSTFE